MLGRSRMVPSEANLVACFGHICGTFEQGHVKKRTENDRDVQPNDSILTSPTISQEPLRDDENRGYLP